MLIIRLLRAARTTPVAAFCVASARTAMLESAGRAELGYPLWL
jgi:hypothetical protein